MTVQPMHSPVPFSHRLVAKAVDLLFVFLLAGTLPYPLGPFSGFLYSLWGDALSLGRGRGQSIGKRLMGLRVIRVYRETSASDVMSSGSIAEEARSSDSSDVVFEDLENAKIRKAQIHLRAATLRNSPFGVATFFGLIPVWGWFILGLVGVPLMAMEVYLMLRVGKGRRLGDVMGDTEVIQA